MTEDSTTDAPEEPATLVYSFDRETGLYIGSELAHPDPLDGGWLLPAGATFTAVPEIPAGQQAVFTNNAWVLQAIPPAPEEPEPPETPQDQVIKANLAAMDSLLQRSTEDVVYTLIGKGLMAMTDLPPETQQHFAAKAAARAELEAYYAAHPPAATTGGTTNGAS